MQILAKDSLRANSAPLSFAQAATNGCSAVAKEGLSATNCCSAVAIQQLGYKGVQYNAIYLSDAEKARLLKWIAQQLGLSLEDIQVRSRKAPIAKARAIISTLAHLKYGLSSPVVGAIIKRDHASVLNHCKSVYKQLFYKEFNQHCQQLEERLNAVHPGKGNLFLSIHQIPTYYDQYRIR